MNATAQRQAIYALQNRRMGAKNVDPDTLMTARQRRRCVKKAHHEWAVLDRIARQRTVRGRAKEAIYRIWFGERRAPFTTRKPTGPIHKGRITIGYR